MNRNIFLLSIGFGLIFFSFGGIQDFLTIILKSAGKSDLAYWSLGVLYGAFMLGNFPAAKLIPILGLKRMMILGAVSYALYIFSLINMSAPWIIAASAILGFGAAALWNAQGVYLVWSAEKGKLGQAAGVFTTIWGLSSFAGVSLVGFILQFTRVSTQNLFLLLTMVSLIGVMILFFLEPVAQNEIKENREINFFKLLSSKTLFGVSLIWVLMVFAEGFSFSVLPVMMKRELPTGLIGLLLALRRLTPIGLSFIVGIISDRIGRGKVLRAGVLMYLASSVFFFWTDKTMLIVASLLLALGFAVMRPATFAAVKDISPKGHLPAINAYLYMVSNLAVLGSIILGGIKAEMTALLGMGILAVLAAILSVPLVLDRNIKKKILSEISK